MSENVSYMAYDQRDELKLQVYKLWFKIVFFFFKVYFIYSFTFTTVIWALARRKTSSVPFLT